MKNHASPPSLLPLVVIVAANYGAQIPYYFHQYYAPHRLFPSLVGSILLLATLAWFTVSYRMYKKGSRLGWWLLTAYLLTVFLFYLQTQIMQYVATHHILLYVYHPSSIILFIVFGIGYLNCLAAAYYVAYMMARRQDFLTPYPDS